MGAVGRFEVAETAGGCTFRVHVAPRSHRDAVAGLYGDALKVRLKAPPVEGQANQALQSLLADLLGVSRDNVEIVAGHTSRSKTVRVSGVRAAQVRALLEGTDAE
jgi:uncharacterized protein (TIGR00251 family)